MPVKSERRNGAQQARVDDADSTALRQAYFLLARADHDYRGHRVKALNEVRNACEILGLELRGDGRGRENQVTSDFQLRQAQGLLERVRVELAAKKQKRVLQHVNAAINQISTALRIR